MRPHIYSRFILRLLLMGSMAFSFGCASSSPEVERVVLHNAPDNRQALDLDGWLDVSTTERLAYEFGAEPISELDAREAVRFVLLNWDKIPKTSVFYLYQCEFADLRAQGYEFDGAFYFELLPKVDGTFYGPLFRKAIVITKNKPVVLLIYPDGSRNTLEAPGAVRP